MDDFESAGHVGRCSVQRMAIERRREIDRLHRRRSSVVLELELVAFFFILSTGLQAAI